MIPDIAVIISTYAIARLLCEYIIVGETVHQLRVMVSIIAMLIIGVFLYSVLDTASGIDLSGL